MLYRHRARRALRVAVRAPAAPEWCRSSARAVTEGLEPRRLMAAAPAAVPATLASFPAEFTDTGGGFAVFAATAAAGRELYRTDGTASGTTLVKDLLPGGGGSNPGGFLPLAPGLALFTVSPDAGDVARGLWRTDGTADGTYPLPAPPLLLSPLVKAAAGGTAYFLAFGDGAGIELWRTDGTPGGTGQVVDLFPGPGSGAVKILGTVGGTVVFLGSDDHGHGAELWTTDGTAAGTRPLAEVVPGSGGLSADGAAAGVVADVAGGGQALYFTLTDPARGTELWRTDGTPAGTAAVDLTPGTPGSGPRELTSLGGQLLFVAVGPLVPNGFPPRDEMYTSDGTVDGTRPLFDSGYRGHVGGLTRSGDHVYFSRATGDFIPYNELWRTDGTAAGTVQVATIPTSYIHPPLLTDIAGTLYFAGSQRNPDPSPDWEYWRSDGTTAGTYRIADLNPGTGSAYPYYGSNPPFRAIGSLGARALLAVDDGVHGAEPWVSDGTAAGTTPLADLNTYPAPGDPPTAAVLAEPLVVPEGGQIGLSGQGSAGPSKTIVRYEWDLNYDGTRFDVDWQSKTPTFSAAGLDGPTTRTVAVRVTDSAGLQTTDAAVVTVTNVAPIALFNPGPPVRPGQPATFAFSGPVTDPSAADVAAGFRYSFDFNDDGDFTDPGDVRDSTSMTAARAFVAAGTYAVRGRVSDKDGGATDYTATVTILPPLPPPVLNRRAAADAHVRNGPYANANYGLAGALEVRKSTTAGNSREAYLRFDLSGVPSAGAITSAKVRLWGRASSGTAATTVGVGLYTVASTSWIEGGLRWNTKPVAGTAALSVKTVRGTAGAWYEFDVTAYLQARKRAGATSVGFALKGTAFGTPWAAFNSDEAAANRPELRVTSRGG